MHFLLIILLIVAVMFTLSPAVRFTLGILNTDSIENVQTRRTVNAVIGALVQTVIWAVGWALIGMGYTVVSFLFVWGILTLLEYISPTRRR